MSAPTRRHWAREAREVIGYPLSMFRSGHAKSGEGKPRKLSQFRVVVFMFAVSFVWHWPASPWGMYDWLALAVIALALPVADLFAGVPFAEGLSALTAVLIASVTKKIPNGEK